MNDAIECKPMQQLSSCSIACSIASAGKKGKERGGETEGKEGG